MPIDFHDEKNRFSYTTRQAHSSWEEAIGNIVDIQGKRVADIGCGGGIYSKALVDMQAASVTSVDFSEEMLKGAQENCRGYSSIQFVLGNALDTGLPDSQYDVILERALIHHVERKALQTCFAEAFRLLVPGGIYIIQDRTPEDSLLPGSATNVRGYLFSRYPKLKEKEVARRMDNDFVLQTFDLAGFQDVQVRKLNERGKVYANTDALTEDLLARVESSILHDLTDAELQDLAVFVREQLKNRTNQEIIEQDRWTIWSGRKGAR